LGIIRLRNLSTPKVADQELQCMFIGYPQNHAGDCYEMWDAGTGRLHVTRDVIWTNQMYFEEGTPSQPSPDEPVNRPVISILNILPPTNEENDPEPSTPSTTPAVTAYLGTGVTIEELPGDESNKLPPHTLTSTPAINALVESESLLVDTASENKGTDINVDAEENMGMTGIEAGESKIEEVNTGITRTKMGNKNKNDKNIETTGTREEKDAEHIQGTRDRVTRSGQEVRPPNKLIHTHMLDLSGLAATDINDDDSCINEFGFVGSGIGGGFGTTDELHVMKYLQAMKGPDRDRWKEAICEEYKRMESNGVFEAIPKSEIPPRAKVMSSTWAMKKKASGTY
jgi:hypothetical protein